jgi:hypothetical protein
MVVMESLHPLQRAIDIVGLIALARELKVSHQAIRKWQMTGRMPRTEWSGETGYCEVIERLTAGVVTRDMLLAKWPAFVAKPREAARASSAAVAARDRPHRPRRRGSPVD